MEAPRIHDKMIDDISSSTVKNFSNVEIVGKYGIRYFVDAKLTDQYRDFELRRFDGIWFYFTVFVSSAFSFWLLNQLLSRLWSKTAQTTKANRALINNSVSLVHSLVAACIIHYDFKVLTPLMLEDLRQIHSPATLFLLAFCGGYFLYDLIDIQASATGRALFELVCHHAIIIINYTYVLYRREYCAYCSAFLFCESNSIFLHCRQLMLYNQIPKTSLIFRINAVLNYLTFIVYRLINCFWLSSYMIYNFGEMTFETRFLMVSSVPAITVVQIPLLYRIIYSDWFKTNAQQTKMNFD